MTPKVEPCRHHPLEIHCTETHKCDTCGWNPAVKEKRIKEARRRAKRFKEAKTCLEKTS